MKSLKLVVIIVFVVLSVPGRAAAGGPFGPPQPIAKEAGGYHSGIGYWFHEDKYKNGTEQVTRQRIRSIRSWATDLEIIGKSPPESGCRI